MCVHAHACVCICTCIYCIAEIVNSIETSIKQVLGEDLYKSYHAGSAYEKLQSCIAHDYDIMLFINIER